MIKPNFITACRDLLGWSRQELANLSGVSMSTLSKMEDMRQEHNIDTSHYKKITTLFEANGVFINGDTIKKQNIFVNELSDYMQVMEDIERTLPDGGTIRVHCADDSKSSPEITAKLAQMRSKGYQFLTTTQQGNNVIQGVLADYRWIPAELFNSSEVQVIYGSKSVQHVMDEGKSIFLVVNSNAYAMAERKKIDYWWNSGQQVGAS